MAKFVVSVIETLTRLVSVDADSKDDALQKAYEAWCNEEIVLDESDLTHEVDLYIYDEDPDETVLSGCKNYIR